MEQIQPEWFVGITSGIIASVIVLFVQFGWKWLRDKIRFKYLEGTYAQFVEDTGEAKVDRVASVKYLGSSAFETWQVGAKYNWSGHLYTNPNSLHAARGEYNYLDNPKFGSGEHFAQIAKLGDEVVIRVRIFEHTVPEGFQKVRMIRWIKISDKPTNPRDKIPTSTFLQQVISEHISKGNLLGTPTESKDLAKTQS